MIIPALLAPLLAGTVAAMATVIAYRLRTRMREGPPCAAFASGRSARRRWSRWLTDQRWAEDDGRDHACADRHGTLDADDFTIPLWVKVSAAAISLGTYAGGWRIIRTLGTKLTDLEPPGLLGGGVGHGGDLCLLVSRLPALHRAGGLGVGDRDRRGQEAGHRPLGVAGHMGAGWMLTIPIAGALTWGAFELADVLGIDSVGPAVLAVLAALGFAGLFALARRNPVTAANVG